MSGYPLSNILFLDIETVSQYASFNEVPEEWKDLWSRKAESLSKEKQPGGAELLYNRAAIYAEFGKIICISCGVISGSGDEKKLSLKSFFGHEEKEVLMEFSEMLARWAPDNNKYLCAHNGKEFDFPWLCRRLIINSLPVPALLSISGKKPWEIQHIDTSDLWKFGDYRTYTSLNLLARSLGIPTPKDDIDGSMVGEVYWKQQDLPRIVTYCQKDVITVAQIYLRLNESRLIKPQNIEAK
ncbi:MAG TPA: 3'-5' exonuclease [Puia sp.]|nr:3'-5' exonuclease [Puia sp.]